MLSTASHPTGVFHEEILFDTNFDYIFEYLCNNDDCLLPQGQQTIDDLMRLGTIMSDPGTKNSERKNLNSEIPAIYTYLGQFIDHDITARTDREEEFNVISDPMTGEPANITPASPADVVKSLKNGRRPQLDLDSLFGDGPSFNSRYSTEADAIFENDSLRLQIEERNNGYFDLKRNSDGKAIIADARNDENLMVSQLHAIFIKFYNKIYTRLKNTYPSQAKAYSEARRLTCWAYQYVVLNDYLNQVCDEDIVRETLINGPYYFLTSDKIFMPLEFSVAGFRFGHSMIRPFYKINNTVGEKEIQELLGTTRLLAADKQLDPDFLIDWRNYVKLGTSDRPQNTRLIDPKIARGLFQLNVLESSIPAGSMMAKLTQRNLLRGYLLSIPTGQSVAKAMRIQPLTSNEMVQGFSADEKAFLKAGAKLAENSPLWFYVLQESAVQQNGERLGALGSKIVAETLIGMVKADPNSYLNHGHAQEVLDYGIKVVSNFRPIQDIGDVIEFATSPSFPA